MGDQPVEPGSVTFNHAGGVYYPGESLEVTVMHPTTGAGVDEVIFALLFGSADQTFVELEAVVPPASQDRTTHVFELPVDMPVTWRGGLVDVYWAVGVRVKRASVFTPDDLSTHPVVIRPRPAPETRLPSIAPDPPPTPAGWGVVLFGIIASLGALALLGFTIHSQRWYLLFVVAFVGALGLGAWLNVWPGKDDRCGRLWFPHDAVAAGETIAVELRLDASRPDRPLTVTFTLEREEWRDIPKVRRRGSTREAKSTELVRVEAPTPTRPRGHGASPFRTASPVDWDELTGGPLAPGELAFGATIDIPASEPCSFGRGNVGVEHVLSAALSDGEQVVYFGVPLRIVNRVPSTGDQPS